MTQRAREILARLPADKPVKGAEIGVFDGATSEVLLSRPQMYLVMVDSWAPFLADGILIADEAEQRKNYLKAFERTYMCQGSRHIIKKESDIAAKAIKSGSLDFVFIDADHSFNAVSQDIRTWAPKLRRGGLLCGHDYANNEYGFGREVKRAVDEYAKKQGLTVEKGKDYTWFIRLR